MNCEIELRINGNKVDIVNEEQFAQQFSLTYSFSDLSEPDKVTDTYSKSITLPGTANNNNIFGHIWKLDSNNVEQFNPSLLSTFELYLNKELWQSGTVQLQEINRSNNVYTYKIVLYGNITRVMSMLLNSDIDDSDNKLLRSLNFPGHKLRHMLYGNTLQDMWNTGDRYTGEIHLGDYMQYVPCQNGLYDNFDSSKKLAWYYPHKTSVSGDSFDTPYIRCVPIVFEEKRLTATSQVFQATSGDQEFDEYPMRQWRVEYQRPGIKINKLIEQIVADSSSDVNITLDTDFFNSNNPYWSNTYLVLGQYNTDTDEGEVTGTCDTYLTRFVDTNSDYTDLTLYFTQKDGNITLFAPDSSTVIYYGNLSGSKKISLEFLVKVSALSTTKISKGQYGNEPFFANGYYYDTFGKNYMDYYSFNTWTVLGRALAGAYSANSTRYTNGAYDSSLHSGIYPQNSVANGHRTFYNQWSYEYYTNNYGNYRYAYTMRNNDINYLFTNYTPINDTNRYWKPFKLDIDVSGLNQNGTIEIWFSSINHNFIACNDGAIARSNNVLPVLITVKGITAAPAGTSGNSLNNYFPYSYGYTGNGATVSYNRAIRSGDMNDGATLGIGASVVTTEDMFDNVTTQGEMLLNYTKLLGLLYDVDASGNIKIVSRNKYFNDYKVFDWTDKVDLSREFKIKPLTFDKKYLNMGYKSGDTYYENKYSSNFGLNYGDKRINTGYVFSTESKDLLDSTFVNTVVADEPRKRYYPAYRKLYPSGSNDNYIGYVAAEATSSFPYAAFFTKDGNTKNKADDVKFNLMFNAEQVTLDRYTYYATVDSSWMLSTDASVEGGQFCWVNVDSSNGGGQATGNYPALCLGVINSMAFELRKMPKFTTHYDEYSWDIGYPRISYDGATSITYPSGSTVYSRFWDSYISEIYNVRNKILTCYVKLSWIDILNFSFKNFVIINGVLYHPNKLLNVNPLSDDPVQVELIQVQNIAGYTEGQIIPGGTVVSDAKIKKLKKKGIVQTDDDEE